MASAFSTLLEATLAHLSDLQATGVRHVEVEASTLQALAGPRRSLRASGIAPAPSPTTAAPQARRHPPAPAPSSAAPAMAGVATATRSAIPGFDAPKPAPESAALVAARPADSTKEADLASLRAKALACVRCPHLVGTRTQVVFGVGHPEARLMFVGEAPGADEDRRGEPFVGPAGQLLTKIIQAMGLSREQVYIANILKCRPDMPPGATGNRPPRPEEMETCKPYLLEQIEIIRPEVLVALGGTAVSGLFGIQDRIGSLRGRWLDFRGIPVMPTFHPSYLLRSEDGPDRGHGQKRKTWEDMLQVLERLRLPISEKMRGFFSKPTPPVGGAAA